MIKEMNICYDTSGGYKPSSIKSNRKPQEMDKITINIE
jgi:hypothetical protein